jgi:cephalosporin hydroxylase
MRDWDASFELLKSVHGSGPGMHKIDSDLARYQWIIDKVKPDIVVETGLYYGGSLLWFAERVPYVISVELDPKLISDFKNNVHGLGEQPENAIIIEGNSLEAFDRVAVLIPWKEKVMVSLDSDHGTDTVLGEMRLYSKLVTPGSYMVVEDGILEEYPGNWFDGSPIQAIGKFFKENDEFEVDEELEDMYPTTFHPLGWLRRKSSST